MADNDRARDLAALRNLIDEAHLVISTATLPEGRGKRAEKLLTAALSLAGDLIANPAPTTSAAALGARGGLKTAERGSDYFRKLASKRKTKAGGRPKAQAEPIPPPLN